MIPQDYECREGKGIKLFINPKSRYGLTQYTPIKEDHMYYNEYCEWKKLYEENPEWTFRNLNREETSHFIHCMGCDAAKINNFRRYCSTCPDFYDFWEKMGREE